MYNLCYNVVNDCLCGTYGVNNPCLTWCRPNISSVEAEPPSAIMRVPKYKNKKRRRDEIYTISYVKLREKGRAFWRPRTF